MGNSRKEATIVGVVVFAAFLVVLWTIFYLQGFVARRNKNFYSARFEQVGLLMVGDDVTVAGVPVGRVQWIGLEGREAVVRFFVEQRVEVTENTVAMIDASDVFGEAYLQLRIQDGPPVESGGSLKGELAPGLRDLIKQGVTVVDRTILVLEDARKLVARLDTMLGAESSFAQTLENVEVLTANTRDFSSRFDHYGSLLEETMSSLDSAALGFRSVVDDNAQSVQQAIAGLEDISMRLDTLLVDIESGRGALGRMLKDERLYEELRQTALEARNLIREIREHPDKYIKLDVF
jgi:phospholipid/cholesterol/gamma-HCH transport system substrate-binding protein